MRLRVLILALFTPFFAYTSQNNSYPTENYYRLKDLDRAREPRIVEMVTVKNMKENRPVVTTGILFTYNNRNARDVRIAGSFSKWNLKPMTRGQNGVWFYYLDGISDRGDVTYKYFVDDTWIMDPENTLTMDDRAGSYVSVVEFPGLSEGKHLTFRMLDGSRIEFRTYNREATLISLVGDFNHWNPENDLMEREPGGVWRLVKRLPPGRYRYMYIVDGRWVPDVYNEKSAADENGDIVSILEVR